MSDDEENQPFRLLVNKDATPVAPPRVGPTMQAINERLGRITELADQVLKRQQQTALMVDGFGTNLNRRIDLLHEEAALLRVSVSHPANDADADVSMTTTVPRTPAQRARALVALPVKFASYATAAAVVLRLLGKQFPDYQEAIDGLLGVFGL